MTSNADSRRKAGNGPVGVSGPTRSLWLHLLRISSLGSGAGLILCCLLAWIFDGGAGALSAAFAGLIVMVFFGISLLVGHYVGRNNPSGAVGAFVGTYFIKVVGFGAVLFFVGAPEWLNDQWFLVGAVTAVVLWQAAELFGFSKARLQLYNDPDEDGRTHA